MSGFCVSMLAHLSDRHFARLILGQAVDHAFRYIEVGRPPRDMFHSNFQWENADCMYVYLKYR